MRVTSSKVFCHVTEWMFAFTFLVLSIESAVAESITVRVVSASPAQAVDGHSSIYVTLDADSARDLARFTTAHVGQAVEVRCEGKLLMKPRLRTALTGGSMQIVDYFGSDDVESLASDVVSHRQLAISASGPPAR
jgi:preprotein translocase subunit SecD